MTLSDKRTACVITGASQGLGKAFAEQWCSQLGPDSKLILTSRSLSRLEGVRSAIMQKEHKHRICIELVEWNISNPDVSMYQKELKRLLPPEEKFDAAVLIHNAFNMGNLERKVEDLDDPAEIRAALDPNIVSMILLTSAFLKAVHAVKDKFIVNLTAPSADRAVPSLGLPGAAKAARQNILNCLALESPDVKVLHFDPGLVDTSSLRSMRDKSHDDSLRDKIKGFFEKKLLLSEDDVAEKLWKTIDDGRFTSGSTVNALELRIPIHS